MKKLTKIAIGLGGALVAYPCTVPFSTAYLAEKKDDDIEEYITANLEEAIQAQEKKLEIKYSEERPQLFFTLPPDAEPETIARYNSAEDNLYFRSGILTRPGFDWSDSFATFATAGGTHSAKRTLDHELGHVYTDQVGEKNGLHKWPAGIYLLPPLLLEAVGLRMISEGIAVYFDKVMNGEDYTLQEEWPKNRRGFTDHIIYYGGYVMVKPIIDQYKAEGIEYLMFNPPREEELFDLPVPYQQRILHELSQKNKEK